MKRRGFKKGPSPGLKVYFAEFRWLKKVYADYLRTVAWPTAEGPVPCMATGKTLSYRDLVMDHMRNRESFPELKHDPMNWAIVSRTYNIWKGSKRVDEYRPKGFIRLLSERRKRDFEYVLGKWSPRRKGIL